MVFFFVVVSFCFFLHFKSEIFVGFFFFNLPCRLQQVLFHHLLVRPSSPYLFIYLFIYTNVGKSRRQSYRTVSIQVQFQSPKKVLIKLCRSATLFVFIFHYVRKIIAYVCLCLSLFLSWTVGHPDKWTTVELLV